MAGREGRGVRVVGVRVGSCQGARDVAAVGAEVEDGGEGAFDVLFFMTISLLAIENIYTYIKVRYGYGQM